jgi:hypothetical protein
MDAKTLIKKFNDLNKIQNIDTLRINMYGYISEIILSTELFKNNKDLSPYFSSINIEHKKYLYASRTLIISMTIRKIQKMDGQELFKLQHDTLNYLVSKDPDSFTTPEKSNIKQKKKDDYVEGIINKYSRSK